MTEIRQEDRDAAVDAVRAIVEDGFVVGCCAMSGVDGDEFASSLSNAFAKHRIAALESAAAECDKRHASAVGWRYGTAEDEADWVRFDGAAKDCALLAQAIRALK